MSHGSPLPHSLCIYLLRSFKCQQLLSTVIYPPNLYTLAKWSHLNDLHLADPDFGQPNKIMLTCCRRKGPPGTPTAFETKFGWVLTSKTDDLKIPSKVAAHHAVTLSGDDILRKFWEIEECPRGAANHSPEERAVVRHFDETHKRNEDGRFVVPLPKNPQTKPLGVHPLFADSFLWSDPFTPKITLMNFPLS